MSNKYVGVRPYSTEEVLDAIANDYPTELRVVIVGTALHHDDRDFVESQCIALSEHENDEVRGNAILGFGYIAYRFRELDKKRVKPIVEAGIVDSSEHVRGQSWAAAGDITHCLGWAIEGFEE